MKLIVQDAARLEEHDAADWYGKESAALVRRFRAELKQVLHRVQASPEQFPLIGGGYRRALLTVFPYSIIFEQTPTTIFVVAISHNSREPSYWRNRRLSNRTASDLL